MSASTPDVWPKPPRARTTTRGGSFVLQVRLFNQGVLLILFLAVLWNGFFAFGCWMGDWHPLELVREAPFVLIHLAIGALMAGQALVGLVNTRYLRVREGRISGWTGPVPWGRRRSVPLAEVCRLACGRKAHPDGQGGGLVRYEVRAALTAGGDALLLTGIESDAEALWFAREAGRFLNLPVADGSDP